MKGGASSVHCDPAECECDLCSELAASVDTCHVANSMSSPRHPATRESLTNGHWSELKLCPN